MKADERGWTEFTRFEESMRYELVTISRLKGTIRGLHYNKGQSKIVRCVNGSIFDVVVDLRKDLSTYLKCNLTFLNVDSPFHLYVPDGFAHGYQVLEDYTEVVYLLNKSYSSTLGLRYDDPLLSIKWPLTPSIISYRDKSWPLL